MQPRSSRWACRPYSRPMYVRIAFDWASAGLPGSSNGGIEPNGEFALIAMPVVDASGDYR